MKPGLLCRQSWFFWYSFIFYPSIIGTIWISSFLRITFNARCSLIFPLKQMLFLYELELCSRCLISGYLPCYIYADRKVFHYFLLTFVKTAFRHIFSAIFKSLSDNTASIITQVKRFFFCHSGLSGIFLRIKKDSRRALLAGMTNYVAYLWTP